MESSSKKLMDSPKTKRIHPTNTRSRCICLSITAAVVLLLGLLFLILGLTVFKAKKPVTTINSVSLDNLAFGFDMTRLRVLLNLTLDTNVSVRNPNRVGFKYNNSTAVLRHRNNQVGEAPVPGGRIGARDTKSMNLTITIMADRLLSDSALFSDVRSGVLPFQTYIRIAGKVRILFNIHVVTYTTCDMDIDLTNRTVSNLNCHYKTKL